MEMQSFSSCHGCCRWCDIPYWPGMALLVPNCGLRESAGDPKAVIHRSPSGPISEQAHFVCPETSSLEQGKGRDFLVVRISVRSFMYFYVRAIAVRPRQFYSAPEQGGGSATAGSP